MTERVSRQREWQKRNPTKLAAQQAVQDALKSGRLSRQPCTQCGAEPAEAHHDDYGKPLDVRWLCPSCHRGWHKAQRGPRRPRIILQMHPDRYAALSAFAAADSRSLGNLLDYIAICYLENRTPNRPFREPDIGELSIRG